MANMYAKKKIMQETLETAIGNIYSKSLEQGFLAVLEAIAG
jgi:hypothetical protein